jgi:two-component system OmpR family response regulator
MPESRILVTTGDDQLARVLAFALRRAAFDVEIAPTAIDAIRALGAQPRPDLLVIEVALPDISGFELCKGLRTSGDDLPLIFIGEAGPIEDRLYGLSIGGDDFLTVPFDPEELVVRTGVVLRRVGRPERPALMCRGDLTLDDDAHLVRRGAEPIALTPTEFRVLRLLMRNPGAIVSREQMLDHVWNCNFRGEPAVIETFISTLRKKLGAERHTLIETVRGHGYRLGAGASR